MTNPNFLRGLCAFCGALLCIFLLLVSCSAPPTMMAGPSSTQTPTVESPSTQTPKEKPPSTQTSTVGLPSVQEPTGGPPATPTPSVGPSSAQTSFQICSPLGWETIPELFEIVSAPYAPPPPGRDERHHGVDFSHYSRKGHPSMQGEPVQAILAGRVAAAIQNRLPYGNMVIIETTYANLPAPIAKTIGLTENQSLYLLYAHFEEAPLVELGEIVICGQELGRVGTSGYNIINAHLHLEARRGTPGAVFESMAFYTTNATPIEMENYKRWRTSGEFEHFDPLVLLKSDS